MFNKNWHIGQKIKNAEKINNLNGQFSEEYLGALFKPIYSLRANSEKGVAFLLIFQKMLKITIFDFLSL